MKKQIISKIKKRDGRIVKFDQDKITQAIYKAIMAVDEKDGKKAKKLSDKVLTILEYQFDKKTIPTVEEIQDIVEKVLIKAGLVKIAKAYILYRRQRAEIRELRRLIDSEALVEKYLDQLDWRVRENANMDYSLQGLNYHIFSAVTSQYWLSKIYPEEIKKAHLEADFHIHDLGIFAAYCTGWDLKDLLLKGFGGVNTKVESKPPKHLRTALGQLVNFFFTLQGEVAGAIAFSNFDTYLAPFIRYDKLNYQQVKQVLQEFIFNMSVPTRVGFQNPFTNITLDLKPPKVIEEDSVIIGGELQKEEYKDFQKEMDMLNQAFSELVIEGDAKGRVFTFPIPTYNITKDFDWGNPIVDKIFEVTAKYGIPYFANFVNSDLKPEDVRSMCCRLRLSNQELYKRGGGLFGAYPLTGSIGVVTINMAKIGYLSKTKKEFFKKLVHLMDLAKQSLEIKRKTIEKFTEDGLYPYCRYYLGEIKKHFGYYWRNHFSTIGLVGMNEACLNFLKENIASQKGRELTLEVLDFMRHRLVSYQKETGHMYNLEATPAEGASYRLARIDKESFPKIITAGKKEPYYTNSTQLPVNFTDDIFEALDLQDEFQTKYTGGTVLHIFVGERITDTKSLKSLIRKIAENYHLPYYTITPTFSICPEHGYISGEHFRCSQCQRSCEVYSRVAGYLRPVQQWNWGKQEEFKDRKKFKIEIVK